MNQNTDYIAVPVQCPFCNAKSEVEATLAGLRAWQEGALVQVAFPNMTPNDRELLMTGICDSCWPAGEDS